ncbi:5159_t:CDS:2, partial [Entrophospora sp. SA101]
MSFLPTDQQIKDIQEAGIPLTTKKNTEFWVKVLTNYREKHHNGIPIESVNDKKILEKQLCEFVVGVRRDDGEEYLSLKKLNLHDLKKQGKISTKKADTLSPDEIKQILNHPSTSKDTPEGLSRRVFIWVCLVFCPHGGEHTKMLKCQFDIRDDMVIFTKFHQKNDQSGLDGNNESLNIPCPRDKEHQGAYDDIISYLTINDDVWYLDHKIGTEKIKNYMKTICFDAVNHSGRATSLIWLYQSGVDDTQVMTISGHKSLKGVRSYISPTIYQKASKISNVLQMALTLQESSTSNKTPQKNTGSDIKPEDIEDEDNSDELDDMSDKGSGVKSLG